jgi:hypothetical protein
MHLSNEILAPYGYRRHDRCGGGLAHRTGLPPCAPVERALDLKGLDVDRIDMSTGDNLSTVRVAMATRCQVPSSGATATMRASWPARLGGSPIPNIGRL